MLFFPSVYTGGELLIRHLGKEVCVNAAADFSRDMRFARAWLNRLKLTLVACSPQWAAFFTDCEHEVKPVTSGHRVAIQYHLYAEGDEVPSAPARPSAEHRNVEGMLRSYWVLRFIVLFNRLYWCRFGSCRPSCYAASSA